MNYITTVSATITNNNGGKMGTMPANTPFTSDGWVKDGRLNIGNSRWIPVGTYKLASVTPPTDPPPPVPTGAIYHLAKSTDGGKNFDAGIYLQVIDR